MWTNDRLSGLWATDDDPKGKNLKRIDLIQGKPLFGHLGALALAESLTDSGGDVIDPNPDASAVV